MVHPSELIIFQVLLLLNKDTKEVVVQAKTILQAIEIMKAVLLTTDPPTTEGAVAEIEDPHLRETDHPDSKATDLEVEIEIKTQEEEVASKIDLIMPVVRDRIITETTIEDSMTEATTEVVVTISKSTTQTEEMGAQDLLLIDPLISKIAELLKEETASKKEVGAEKDQITLEVVIAITEIEETQTIKEEITTEEVEVILEAVIEMTEVAIEAEVETVEVSEAEAVSEEITDLKMTSQRKVNSMRIKSEKLLKLQLSKWVLLAMIIKAMVVTNNSILKRFLMIMFLLLVTIQQKATNKFLNRLRPLMLQLISTN
jgi:hypothetical protein